MKINLAPYLIVKPRIVLAHRTQEIEIVSKFPEQQLNGTYEVFLLPRYFFSSQGRSAPFESFICDAEQGSLKFSFSFCEEQEYILALQPQNGNSRVVYSTSLYALEDDLYGSYVLKGDLHMHTTCSDGAETPKHRVAAARMVGHDFLAITDHNSDTGSIEAKRVVDLPALPMTAIHGEEIHAADCPVHILALGASRSIVPEVAAHSTELYSAREAILAQYGDSLPDNVDRLPYAAAMDVFRRIREAGGISVLCHIYWEVFDWYHKQRLGAPQQLVDALVAKPLFDVFELTSGAPKEDLSANYLQAAYYAEKLPKHFPIIGITDSHCTLPEANTIFGKNYTIVFSENRSEQAILQSIIKYRSVSVDGVGDNPILRGDVRLCKYAKFLLQYYFPFHDFLLRQEGVIIERMLQRQALDASLSVSTRYTAERIEEEWGGLKY